MQPIKIRESCLFAEALGEGNRPRTGALGKNVLAVIPGRRKARNSESIVPVPGLLDFGHAAMRRPGMTKVEAATPALVLP